MMSLPHKRSWRGHTNSDFVWKWAHPMLSLVRCRLPSYLTKWKITMPIYPLCYVTRLSLWHCWSYRWLFNHPGNYYWTTKHDLLQLLLCHHWHHPLILGLSFLNLTNSKIVFETNNFEILSKAHSLDIVSNASTLPLYQSHLTLTDLAVTSQ